MKVTISYYNWECRVISSCRDAVLHYVTMCNSKRTIYYIFYMVSQSISKKKEKESVYVPSLQQVRYISETLAQNNGKNNECIKLIHNLSPLLKNKLKKPV